MVISSGIVEMLFSMGMIPVLLPLPASAAAPSSPVSSPGSFPARKIEVGPSAPPMIETASPFLCIVTFLAAHVPAPQTATTIPAMIQNFLFL